MDENNKLAITMVTTEGFDSVFFLTSQKVIR